MSFAEILVVLLVALIVLGPKRLPEVAYWFGRTMRVIQHAYSYLQKALDDQIKLAELKRNEARAEMAERQQKPNQQNTTQAPIKPDSNHDE